MTLTTHEVTIQTLTYGGDGLGRLADGRAVFVPFVLPDERVQLKLVEEKRNYARAELVEVLEPSPKRIQARCTHFGVCGGCHYQHMPYAEQLKAKKDVLRDQLERIGKLENPPINETVPCSSEWNYRNHVQFHLTNQGKLGYVEAGQAPGVFPVRECHLPEPSIDQLWPQLEFDPETGLERVSLRSGTSDELMLVLETDELEAPEVSVEAGISVVHLVEDDALVLAGDDYLVTEIAPPTGGEKRAFKVSAASFFQVNTEMAGKMVAHLIEHLPLPVKTILDVYCGAGLFSAYLAPHCQHLVGIEVSPSACEDFTVNLDEFDHVELYEAPAEDVLPALDLHPDIVLVDPPRAGLDRRALDGILALGAGTLAYVSCDPSTLARDAARLVKGGYQLVEVTPFDLFPQTYHIESISIFHK
jgi:23S rRNA (uracil1939-C5)-methyltransferase